MIDLTFYEFKQLLAKIDPHAMKRAVASSISNYAKKRFASVRSVEKKLGRLYDTVENEVGVRRKRKISNGDKGSNDKRENNTYRRNNWQRGGGDLNFLLAIYYWLCKQNDAVEYVSEIDQALFASKSSVFDLIETHKLKNSVQSKRLNAASANQLDSSHQNIADYSNHPHVGLVSGHVHLRLNALREQFYGRAHAQSTLDAFVEQHDRGIFIVTAPAGAGKSALLANWIAHRQAVGDQLAYHFIQNTRSDTTIRDTIEAHLKAQIVRFIGGHLDPDNAQQKYTNKQLSALFAEEAPEGCRRIIVVDGLDEAATHLPPMIEYGKLGKNVFVVVSIRQELDERTEFFESWRDAARAFSSDFELQLDYLNVATVVEWARHAFPELSDSNLDTVAHKLTAATDGVPLFLRFLFDDLKMFGRVDAKTLKELADKPPTSFADYIAQQLKGIAQADRGVGLWVSTIRPLLAVLSRTKGPIKKCELESLPSLKNSALLSLDHRVTRWLTIDGEEYSFSHPRLAEVFATVIDVHPAKAKDVLPLLGAAAKKAEQELISWMRDAWKPVGDEGTDEYGASYALDWLPEHLVDQSEIGINEAATLVANPSFLDERLRQDSTKASTRFARNCDLWASLPRTAKTFQGAREWNDFWAENEGKLRLVSSQAQLSAPQIAKAVLFCLGDAGIVGDGSTLQRRAEIAYQPSTKKLIRSIDSAHNGQAIGGLASFGDGLVSWGDDGGLRFWDRVGNLQAYSRDNASETYIVRGVLHAFGGLVTWNTKGEIHFWDQKGARCRRWGPVAARRTYINGITPLKKGLIIWGGGGIRLLDESGHFQPDWGRDIVHENIVVSQDNPNDEPEVEHDAGVEGALAFGEGFLSWGRDGAIRFWNEFGKQHPDWGIERAHRYGVEGVLPFRGGLVSWGGDGKIRFWDEFGKQRHGWGVEAAHFAGVTGVLPFRDGLVSWGLDYAIHFWDELGKQRPNWGAEDAHQHGVDGVFPFADGLISWGGDCIIRFWDGCGKLLEYNIEAAHDEGIKGILPIADGLVSWGDCGVIRFWEGPPIEDGAQTNLLLDKEHQHFDSIVTALPLGRGLVTCNRGGTIRIWDEFGEQRSDWGAETLQYHYVASGIIPFSDGFVSWDHHGFPHFWSSDGVPYAGSNTSDANQLPALGFIQFNEGLISWNIATEICFWDNNGTCVWRSEASHEWPISGVFPVGNGLVSWCMDGSIQLWNNSGVQLNKGRAGLENYEDGVDGVFPFHDGFIVWDREGYFLFWDQISDVFFRCVHSPAHNQYVAGVLNFDGGLISYGGDGIIRFWDGVGMERQNWGVDRAHNGCVKGVLPIDGGLVSWADDGALRFWDASGRHRIGCGSDTAHAPEFGVEEVILLDKKIVSWSRDGTVKYWSLDGHLIDIIVPPGGIRGICHTSDRLFCWGRNLWSYRV